MLTSKLHSSAIRSVETLLKGDDRLLLSNSSELSLRRAHAERRAHALKILNR